VTDGEIKKLDSTATWVKVSGVCSGTGCVRRASASGDRGCTATPCRPLPMVTMYPGCPSQALDGTEFMPGLVGLNNMKNNDYANVCVQILARVSPLRRVRAAVTF